MSSKISSFLLLSVCAASALGCSSKVTVEPPSVAFSNSATLAHATNCEDLEQRYEDDAVNKIELQAVELLRNQPSYGGGRVQDAGVANEAQPASENSDSQDTAAPRDHSETNVQVAGIDEADIVKFDGTRLFVLSGSRLRYLKSWPANESQLLDELEVEGAPNEMFLSGDRLVIFSSARDPRVDYSLCQYDASQPNRERPSHCYGSRNYTKITLVDVNGGALSTAREVYVEGSYNTSRRYDSTVRLILQQWGWWHDWSVPNAYTYLYQGDENGADYITVDNGYGYTYRQLRPEAYRARVQAWRVAATAAVRAKTIADWVPSRFERINGQLVEAAIDCSDHYLPEPGLVNYGSTQVVSFDLANSAIDFSVQEISGYSQTVYSNADTLVLVQPDWSQYQRAYQAEADTYEDRSLVHQFRLSANGGSSYAGSSFVRGQANDQFNLDNKNGVTRIATTATESTVWRPNRENQNWTSTTHNLVTTLQPCDRCDAIALEQLDQLELFTDNERIQSVRYVGDLAYVVTFRQTDPLFAVDVSNASDLRLLGELHIPGFSTYMQPLGANHLLTIGFDADNNGRVTGLALQIFNVSNPTAPTLAHKYTFQTNDSWGSSEAAWNHKAFTYFAARGLLAFPYASWGQDAQGNYQYRSSLEVFRVSAENGFASVASLGHDDFISDYCVQLNEANRYDWRCNYWDIAVRRGVFADDFVYSISDGGVKVHDTRNAAAPVASVPFERSPVNYYGYYGGLGD